MSRTLTQKIRKASQTIALGILAVTASFGLGVETAGDLRTIDHSLATDATLRGDMNADGIVDATDAILILEVAQKYRPATIAELQADPNDNGVLTIDDAVRVLRQTLSR